MKKNILIVGCKNYPAFSSKKIISGGMEVYVTELLEYLKPTYNFIVISGSSRSHESSVKVISVPLIGGFALQPISLLFYSSFISLYLVLTRKIDLVNAQSPLSGLIGLFLFKVFGIPYVVTVHIFASTKEHVGVFSSLYGFIERMVLLNAQKIISAGYKLKEHLHERYRIEEEKIIVVHPGMHLTTRVPQFLDEHIEELLRDESYKILFLGRLIEENGLWDLLEAIRLLKGRSIKLLIAGNGNLESRIKKYISRNNLENTIYLLGIVTGDSKLSLLQKTDISIRTSYHEVFPVAYLEALSFGKPVIATPAGDTEYLTQKTGAITIVPMKNPRIVADEILKHIDSPGISEKVKENCINYIGNIKWVHQASKTDDVFKSVLDKESK
jgi:glycosyltransferase involved in cell wall biosynthesis